MTIIRRSPGTAFVGALAGVFAVAGITWLRLSLSDIVGTEMPLLLYFFAVLPAAALGGWLAGIATMASALLASFLLFIQPHLVPGDAAEWIRIGAFLLESVAISVVIDVLQRRTQRMEELARELARERDHIERMSLEDSLTGLGNHRAFQHDLEVEHARSWRDGVPLTLVAADIDGLKRVNDRFGHDHGDLLIIAVASVLRHCCRAGDTAYRVGGDEFALLMPATSPEESVGPQQRLREAFDSLGKAHHGASASVGAAHMPHDTDDPNGLRRLADSRMYAEKEAKRQRRGE